MCEPCSLTAVTLFSCGFLARQHRSKGNIWNLKTPREDRRLNPYRVASRGPTGVYSDL